MDVTWQYIIFNFVGGLGLFLFGIKSMSDGLQSSAGDRMRLILEKGTKTPIRGVLTGCLVTALIQSSSGTTVLTVGLVNAGLLPLRQAIGVIMGANIGTTVTAYLIGFKLKEYSLPILAIGVLFLLFSKKKRIIYLGEILFGFGALFYGMDVMGQGLKHLKDAPFFLDLMIGVDNNPIMGVLIGILFTAVVQSSSATIGVLQELANQGVITYGQAIPILFGDNIGTTVTAVLAGIGASVAAKRASLTHFLFNFIGTLIFLPLFLSGWFIPFVIFVTNNIFAILPGSAGLWETLNIKMQIAQTHGIFNLSNTLIQLPFVALLAIIVSKVIPGDDSAITARPEYLEPRLLDNTPVALANASRETLRMGRMTSEIYNHSVEYFFTRKDVDKNIALQYEDIVDQLEEKITDYVLKATSGQNLNDIMSNRSHAILHAVGDFERVGDHCINLVELTDYVIEHKIAFSSGALDDLLEMMNRVSNIFLKSLEAFKTEDYDLAREVVKNDDIIDEMEDKLRKSHIFRLNKETCNGTSGAIYIELLSNLERIGDHSVNIAKYILEQE
ncbi:phosphate:Na+ symporter [Desulfonispora thiosulfatigenes DSM 11270]|uniref:Phosphate:Na+ symporter n=1 Tax=Desulfonispora thiosulfatigenes DSM 11270 TaxID=656914 RepID=A0A1W1VGI7_DESTI|nr:Na/Pi cotransporter family protein [Desulfonispora thiosulfatigenes]SMB92191.1 phosphate:Na+ symporter [Desulfonispora thiosulfatigenes DSM 11270]